MLNFVIVNLKTYTNKYMKRKLFALLLALVALSQSAGAQTLRRGDMDGDGEISLSDMNKFIDILLGRHEYVDLGLPSGTLWATCNVGANFPEEYGDYFAWGETEPKTDYSWTTYKWCEGTNTTMTKYCSDESYGTVDSLTVLEPEDDAAYRLWGSGWRMPTTAQRNELSTDAGYVTTDYNATEHGVAGVRLTSKSNGNSIFLPYAGYYNGTTLVGVGHHAAINGVDMNATTNGTGYRWWRLGDVTAYNGTRCYGVTIRPVRSQP